MCHSTDLKKLLPVILLKSTLVFKDSVYFLLRILYPTYHILLTAPPKIETPTFNFSETQHVSHFKLVCNECFTDWPHSKQIVLITQVYYDCFLCKIYPTNSWLCLILSNNKDLIMPVVFIYCKKKIYYDECIIVNIFVVSV